MDLEHGNGVEPLRLFLADERQQCEIDESMAQLAERNAELTGQELEHTCAVDDALANEHLAQHPAGGLLLAKNAVELIA